jgi:aryl-alcohol dehydrogenase-like predicted oxidoreductase
MPAVPRQLLAEGLPISEVVNGLWQIADLERGGREFDLDQAALAMSPYVEAGLTTFDMADHYGSAEVIAGMFGGERTERLTKWTPKPGPVSREDAREAVERSLKRLRTDRIDLLQFHAWSYSDPSWLDALFHLQQLKREGLIRHLGVTNFDTNHLRIALRSGIEIVSNQVSFSLLDGRAAAAMSDFCLAQNVRLLAYGTLLGGFLSEAWLGHDEPDWDALEHMVADEVRTVHPRRGRLGGVPATPSPRRSGGDETRRAHGRGRFTLGARPRRRWPRSSWARGCRKSAHIEDTLRVFDLTLSTTRTGRGLDWGGNT